MMLRRLGATATAATVLLAGCGHGSDDHPKEEPTLQVKTQADATQLVKTLATTVATAVGSPLEKWSTTAVPCDNAAGVTAVNGPWSLNGVGTVAVKPADQVPTLTRLRDQWKQQGYQIDEFRTFPPDNKQGTVSAHVPPENLTISLQSTAPGTALEVIVATPCYRPAPGENPGN
jgi:hypothetical protein